MTTISHRVCHRCNRTIDGEYWSLALVPERVEGTTVHQGHREATRTISADFCVPCAMALRQWIDLVPPEALT